MNLLIGAISGNYNVDDVKTWVETSNFEGVERILLLYNRTDGRLEEYLRTNKIHVIHPDFNFWGDLSESFSTDTGAVQLASSYDLVHNIRFFHIWNYLNENGKEYAKVLVTDVKDVYFYGDPFEDIPQDKLVASSEVILYQDEQWNQTHLLHNLGLIGVTTLLDKPVYNVGVFGGGTTLVRDLCADIYLMSCGKPKVADQTSFNYLINTKYKNTTIYTNLTDYFAVHLHVINAGLVPFNLEDIRRYKIVHQYDRIPGFRR